MAMQHTYATGAATGARAQYATIGGTDSLNLTAADTTGTVSVVANSSSYGANAIQFVTSSSTGDACRVQTDSLGTTEFRTHIIMDMPTLTSGQWINILTGYATNSISLVFNQAGNVQLLINGTTVYDSGAGKLPAAGTTIRLSVACSLTAWSVAAYNDTATTLLASGSGTTTALSGTFGALFFGKTAWQSGANVTMVVRAIRVESGPGTSLAVLPAETALTPAKGNNIVPIRFVSNSGSTPVPSGASLVGNLSDANTSTTVVVATGSGIRVAMRPMAVVSSDVTFQFPGIFADNAATLSVNLYKPDGTQVGTTKSMSVTTTATLATATFLASELSGLASTDWEGMQLEVLVP